MSFRHSKRCKFIPKNAKMHQTMFGGRAAPGPAGGAKTLPRHPSYNGVVLLLRGGKGKDMAPLMLSRGSASAVHCAMTQCAMTQCGVLCCCAEDL